MQTSFHIKKVAVLGAGVMGAQIAAHCVNAGIETLLYDLCSKDGDHNGMVNKAIANLNKLKPTPLATPETASLLKARNYEDHLADLFTCDLIIEAIAERLDWKEALYKTISPFLNPNSILVSNTSGLSINSLAQVLPEAHRERFCGVHFFNPPRYMHLAELIPSKNTPAKLLDDLETWLTRYLGKGVVRAKDTPNFIANRIGVFSLLATLHHTETMGLGLDEVDALTGSVLGRPKSATFRTMDVVGLDTMQHVVDTMREQLTEDPWCKDYLLPDWLTGLITKGHLGQKTGQGIYRKNGKVIEVYDVKQGSYRLANGVIADEVKSILKRVNPHEKMQGLLKSQHPQARFLVACFRDLFHYSAYHLEDIARSVRDVDLAIRWGFGWQQGPFETWQAAGIDEMTAIINQGIQQGDGLSDAKLPSWLHQLKVFYNQEGAFAPATSDFIKRSQLPVYHRQIFPASMIGDSISSAKILYENEGLSLSSLPNDMAMVRFKTKSNTIDQSVIDGFNQALDIAEKECKGVIIYQTDAANFSGGADLRSVAALIQSNKMSALDDMINEFQQLVMRIKYSALPIIAALRGRALGGGCELMLHASRVVAGFESYPGLVEVGVGLIPAGGGCKEMAMRASRRAEGSHLMDFIRPYFEQIAMASVAGCAPEALARGYLKDTDCWVMHNEEVLTVAMAQIEAMLAANYQPPIPTKFSVAGREGHALLQVGLVNWLEGGFISQHDYFLTNHLANVICGGDVDEGTLVDERWLLTLEREAFIALASTPLSQARIASLLESGKPLRN
jgi:3-hydroxyacyl-CoA dehydrogenase